MNPKVITYFSLVLTILMVSVGCDLAKKVPEGQYLLKENILEIPKEYSFKEDNLSAVIRQNPNFKTAGIKVKLIAFNLVDSTQVAVKRRKKNTKLHQKNIKRKLKERRINERRMRKAFEKGSNVYKPKSVKLKDTINPRPFFREWLKYEYGEAPRIFDNLTKEVSVAQLELYLKRKGFFQGTVDSEVIHHPKKRYVSVKYIFDPGQPYLVDSFFVSTSNPRVVGAFSSFVEDRDRKNELTPPFQFDSDKLTKWRNEYAEYMRDNTFYGFRSSYVSYEVDTLGRDKSMNIAMQVAPRFVDFEGESVKKPFQPTRINNVYFHLVDTLNYKGNFKQEQIQSRGLSLSNLDRLPGYDTLRYDWYDGRNAQYRTATFIYNGELSIKPELIEFQNLLEENNWYRGNYVDQSFNRLLQLDLFQGVTPRLVENRDNTIDVHYYLTPAKQQSFSFEPRATNSNGFLGLVSSINYQHKNIFGGGQKLKISFSGGFESQPEVFDENLEGTFISNAGRSFNTLEFGPTVELEIPGLYPAAITRLSKRQLPKTNVSLAYNYQRRDDFRRQLFQFNYLWRFTDPKRTQVFTIGLPFLGGVQYVEIEKSTVFKERLEQQNDLFLINAYSNQFIWKDLKLVYQYTNQEVRKGSLRFSYSANFDMAGNIAHLITQGNEVNEDGFREFLGVRYSQFVRLDNDFRFNHELKGERSMNYRLQLGAGLPYQNNGPNLPFDYSFFAGGTNDNRGFRARALGPGVYEYYLDTNRTATEIGDIRIGGSLEYRFRISGMFKGAVFSDIGNVWTYNEDPKRMGGQFTTDWFRQLAVAGGVGLRVDLDFLVFRFDIGLPIRNPALPKDSQWIFQSREAYEDAGKAVFGDDYRRLLPNPFTPQVHIAIGYPF